MKTIEEQHEEMVRHLVKDGDAILKTTNGNQAHDLHMVMGIVGEALEIYEHLRYISFDLEEVKKEFGDILFYIKGLFVPLDVSLIMNNKPCLETFEELEKSSVTKTHKASNVFTTEDFLKPIGDLSEYHKKKWIYSRDTNLNREAELLRNVMVSVLTLMRSCCIRLNDVLELNIQKLTDPQQGRYRSGTYSDDQANTRLDEKVS